MNPDLNIREFLNQPSGGTGVIEVNMSQQDRLRGFIAKRGEQAVDGLFRPGVDNHPIHDVGGDGSRLVEMKEVDRFRPVSLHAAENRT